MEQFDLLTFLDQLSPSLGPLSELLTVGLLDLGTFLKTVHEIIAESMAIVNSLYGTFVVPHLWKSGESAVRKEAGGHRNVPFDQHDSENQSVPFSLLFLVVINLKI